MRCAKAAVSTVDLTELCDEILSQAPIGVALVKKGRFVYASESFLRIGNLVAEDIVGRRIFDFFEPSEAARVLERARRRKAGEDLPTTFEVTARGKAGERYVLEVSISPMGDHLLVQARDLTDRVLRREQLSKLAKLGVELHMQKTPEALFSTVRGELAKIGVASTLVIPEAWAGEANRLGRFCGQRVYPVAPRWSAELQRTLEDGVAYVDDVPFKDIPAVRDLWSKAQRRARTLKRGIGVRVDRHMQPLFVLTLLSDWFEREDQPALRLFASQITAALDAMATIGNLSRTNRELAVLHEVGKAIAESLELEQVLQVGAEGVQRLCDASHCMVWLYEPVSQVLRAEAGTPEIWRDMKGTRLTLDEPSLARTVFLERRPAVVKNAQSDPRPKRDFVTRLNAQAVMMAPLLVRGEAVGVLVAVECRPERSFDEADLAILTSVCSQFAVAVDHARLYWNLRKSYAELERTQKQLVQSERLAALGELAAVVAHEVRNPLGVIFNSLSTLRRLLSPTGDARLLFEMMGEEATRLNQIVGDLLDFARPAQPNVRPGSLSKVIDAAIGTALTHAPSGTVTVECALDPHLPEVPMDERLLRQALLNLTLNAIQAMPKGGTLRIRAEQACEQVRIEVADTGIGIPPHAKERIFEPFFTTKATGSGLGLAVVKSIVESHRGAIEVVSEAGVGTRFTVSLPLT